MTPKRFPVQTTRDPALRRCWEAAGGLAAPLAALALWALVVAGVAAPLGAALARLDAQRAPAADVAGSDPCRLPAGALASAARWPDGSRCR